MEIVFLIASSLAQQRGMDTKPEMTRADLRMTVISTQLIWKESAVE